MSKVAWVFPGQGSQVVGMGLDLYQNLNSSRAVFEMADAALDFPISKLCFEGPEEELRQTVNAQPALVVTSLAALEAARELCGQRLPAPAFVAGHSLGEYTALAVAGVFDLTAAVRLARERGRLMHEAGQRQPGSMAAIIGLDEARLAAVCRETGTVMANINCPGQIVISGPKEAVNVAMARAKSAGAARAIPLQVSGAFHSPLMQPAAEGLASFLEANHIADPLIPVIGNTVARPLNTAAEVKKELREQLTSPVQWQQSIEYMVGQGVDTFLEIGPGKVLTGLIRRIDPKVKTVNLGDLESIRAWAAS